MSLHDYVPKKLEEYIIYKPQVKLLLRLSDMYHKKGYINNLIINGIENIGKKTLVYNFVNKLIGNDMTSIKEIEHEIKINNNTITTFFKKSMAHYIIDPSIYINYDKIFISTFIDKYVSTINIYNNKINIVVLENAEKMSKNAQEYLKKKIESISKVTRFILISNSLNKLDNALLSRFVTIFIPYPRSHDLEKIINEYMQKFSFTIPKKIINNLIKLDNKFSIYNFILQIHSYRLYGHFNQVNLEIFNYSKLILNEIEKGEYSNINNIRSILFNLMITTIDNKSFFRSILLEALSRTNDLEKKKKLCKTACECEYKCLHGNKPIIFFELCCSYFFCILNDIEYNQY